METRPMALVGLVLAGLIASSAGYATGGDDRDRGDQREARRLMESGSILPLETILERARSERSGRILEVGLEHRHDRLIYEIELLDDAGVVWELELDAVSGELLKTKRED